MLPRRLSPRPSFLPLPPLPASHPSPVSHPHPPRIEQVVLEDFERATTYAQQFEEYRVIHCFGEHWSFDAYAERQQTATFKESVLAFKQDMAQV